MNINLKDLLNEFVLPLWNQKALSVIDTFVSSTADIQTTFLKGLGPTALKHNAVQLFNAFSNFEFTIQETLQQGNIFIYKWKGKAIHTGIVLNKAPTGEKIHFSGITSVEISERSITRYHCFSDLPRVLTLTSSSSFLPTVENILSRIKEITGKKLTKREIECLRLWLQGFSIKETAKHLGGLSNRTIQTFRESIKRKLNVESYQQLFNLVQNNGIMPLLLTQDVF